MTSSTAVVSQPVASESNLNGYDEFMNWRKSANLNSFTEDIFIEFFREVAATEGVTPESLSTLFFTLKTAMRSKCNVQLGRFILLIDFLRQKGVVIKTTSSSSKGFSDEEINRFLIEAPDVEYLAIKAAAVIGIYADCRFSNLRKIRANMVNDYGTEMVVRIPDRRTNTSKVYSITGEFADILRKYFQLRMRSTTKFKSDRFFLQYRQGKCIGAVMGKYSIAKMAPKIAEFLKLENPENYSGFSFRITASQLADKGFYADTTGRSRSSIAASHPTALVAATSNVVLNNATNSIDCMMRFQDTVADNVLSETSSPINLDTDDETSQTYTIDSASSEDDQDVIEYIDQNGEDCSTTEQQRKSQFDSDIEFVDPPSEPKERVVHYHCGEIVNSANFNVTHQMLQSTIEVQSKEIVRLKQLTDKQSIEIEILKDLLEKSIKRSIRNEK